MKFDIDECEKGYYLKNIGLDAGDKENYLYSLCQNGSTSILSPALWFSQKMRRGYFDNSDDIAIDIEASACKCLDSIFENDNGKRSENIFLLFTRLALAFVNLKMEYDYRMSTGGWEECTDSPWDNEE